MRLSRRSTRCTFCVGERTDPLWMRLSMQRALAAHALTGTISLSRLSRSPTRRGPPTSLGAARYNCRRSSGGARPMACSNFPPLRRCPSQCRHHCRVDARGAGPAQEAQPIVEGARSAARYAARATGGGASYGRDVAARILHTAIFAGRIIVGLQAKRVSRNSRRC